MLSRRLQKIVALILHVPAGSAGRSAMEELTARLSSRHDDIEKLMSISGTPGASVGVLYRGQAYYANHGLRDVQAALPTTENTIYPICSFTKANLAAVAGMAVEDGKLEWDTPVKAVLKDFDIKDDTIREQCTLADLLSHRSGMAKGDYYLGSENNIVFQIEDALKFISNQERIDPFRAGFHYNNLGYELAGLMINEATGNTWSDMMKDRLFCPLQLERTMLDYPAASDGDVAKAYEVLDDGSPTEIPTVKATEHTFGGPSAGMRSCVKDLLKLYKVWLDSANDQATSGRNTTQGSPLVRLNDIMTAKVPMAQPSFRESSYGYGWARVELPNTVGHVGVNPPLMPTGMPIVAKGVPSQLMYYHQGSLPGALHAVFILPETDVVVVVLSNALGLNDCADWIAQLLLEEILQAPERNDYIQAAKTSASETLKWYPDVIAQLKSDRKLNTSARPLSKYIGTYWNEPHYFQIEVTEEGGKLHWAQQGLVTEKFELWHYQDDTFCWLQPRNALVARGRWVDQEPEFWKIKFKSNSDNIVSSLVWDHDVPEEFFKAV